MMYDKSNKLSPRTNCLLVKNFALNNCGKASNSGTIGAGRNSGIPFSSNCVRLSMFEWLFVGIVIVALFCLVPIVWQQVEKFDPQLDYRVPYELNNDYWLFNRYCRWACSKYQTLVVGDSVIWGHFVSQHNTLSHYLNEVSGRNHFVNLGVDGIHPVALDGLLKYYGQDISDKNVVLHLNPLWMSSKKHDLQIEKEFHFNHPDLAPQFFPRIPCYRASYSKRISIVVERYVPFLSWVSHLKKSYFGNTDLSLWTMEHPYKNPIRAVTVKLPAFEDHYQNENIPWFKKGIAKQDFQWVELETSLQWRFFKRIVALLKARGNKVFVLFGPFNEHIMNEKSLESYQKLKIKIEGWLQQNNIPCYMPAALPSQLYLDASHPSAQGYALLAKQLLENQSLMSSVE